MVVFPCSVSLYRRKTSHPERRTRTYFPAQAVHRKLSFCAAEHTSAWISELRSASDMWGTLHGAVTHTEVTQPCSLTAGCSQPG